ncbi:MAG: hypothetical protein KF861_08880 [Planctomycetaceae bacterium]|nr:hypothetical protein [Planctomycetaceae bacterium]
MNFDVTLRTAALVCVGLSWLCPQAPAGERTYDFALVRGGAVIARDGRKTGFPSVVRVPEWVAPEDRAHLDARYYLYYSLHHGKAIRMKWARTIDGPWHDFDLGSRFTNNPTRGVLDMEADPERADYNHVASSDVHVDHTARQFIMFYHGMNQPETTTASGRKVPMHHANFVAFSPDGLNFQAPSTGIGYAGFGPQTVTVEGVTRDLCIGPSYQQAFQHRGRWYTLAKRAILSTPADPSDPWRPHPDNPFAVAWNEISEPTPRWRTDAHRLQPRFFSPAAAFLASADFADHPNNPCPGVRILSHEERLNHLSVCVLPNDHLEIVFYVKMDPDDRFNSLYRLVYDISDSDSRRWDVACDANGLPDFEVLVTPEEIREQVKAANPNFDPIDHADPVSLGSTNLFVDQDGKKYLFFAYVSEALGGAEGEGQIAALHLLPHRHE